MRQASLRFDGEVEAHSTTVATPEAPAPPTYEMFSAALSYSADAERGIISGIASVFGSTAYGAKGPTRFKHGAFAESLRENGGKLPLLYQHDNTKPIGVVTKIMETNEGLVFTGKISKTSLGADVRELLKDGAISGVSIGFDADPGSVSYEKHGNESVRMVGRAGLHELSVVTFPADRKARVLTVHQAAATGETNAAPKLMELLHDSWKGEDRERLAASLAGLLVPQEELAGRVFSEANLNRMKDALAALVELISRVDPQHIASMAAAIEVPKTLKVYGEDKTEEQKANAETLAVADDVVKSLFEAQLTAMSYGVEVDPSVDLLLKAAN